MHVFMLLYIFYQNFQKQTQQDAQGHEGPALKEQKINLITDYYFIWWYEKFKTGKKTVRKTEWLIDRETDRHIMTDGKTKIPSRKFPFLGVYNLFLKSHNEIEIQIWKQPFPNLKKSNLITAYLLIINSCNKHKVWYKIHII